ncbi:MAG: sporulation protein YunB [Selenomonadales bacterium]|nr:sporulation protein YunB [Selenomonadales bacterium]
MKYYIAVSRKNKIIAILLTISILFGSILLWIENGLRPALFTLAEAKINRIAATTISRTVGNIIEEKGENTLLVHTTVDDRGKVVLIQPDTIRFNALTAEITNRIETELDSLQNIPITIPLGQIFGTSLFANCGPEIPIYMKPTGKVNISTQDSFEHVGINQTKHRMYLDIRIDIRMVIPLTEETATVRTAIPLAEYVVVGDVPETYVEIPNNILK